MGTVASMILFTTVLKKAGLRTDVDSGDCVAITDILVKVFSMDIAHTPILKASWTKLTSPMRFIFPIQYGCNVPRAKIEKVTPAPAQSLFYFRATTLNTAINRGVSYVDTTLAQDFLQFTVANDVFAVPPYCPQDDVTLKCRPLKGFLCHTVSKEEAIGLPPPYFCNSDKYIATLNMRYDRTTLTF